MNEESISNPAPFQYMTVCTVSLALLLGLFLIFPLKERVTNAKQVQMMAGVNPVIFWISNFVWDFIVYMIIATILALILYLFDERKTLHSNNGFGTLIFLYMLLGLAGIPWAYILSFPFKSAPSAYAILIISTIVTGVVGPLATFFLRLFYNPDMTTDLAMISDIVRFILTWFGPFFPFGRSFLGFVSVQENNTRCMNQVQLDQLETTCQLFREAPGEYFLPPISQSAISNQNTAACCDHQWGVAEENSICGSNVTTNTGIPIPIHGCVVAQSYWTFDFLYGINIDVIILFIDIILFWMLLGFIETKLLSKGWTKLKEKTLGTSVEQPAHVDEDVQREQKSVYSNQAGVTILSKIWPVNQTILLSGQPDESHQPPEKVLHSSVLQRDGSI